MGGRRRDASDTFTLPRAVLARLVHFCAQEDERPVDVVADAVALHLDELAGDLGANEHRTAEACVGDPTGPSPAHTGGSPPSDDQVVVLPAFLRRRP